MNAWITLSGSELICKAAVVFFVVVVGERSAGERDPRAAVQTGCQGGPGTKAEGDGGGHMPMHICQDTSRKVLNI